MKKFLIVKRFDNEINAVVEKQIRDVVETAGGVVYTAINPDDEAPGLVSAPEAVDAIIALGGDGNLVRTAQNTINIGAPIIGINTGHLGYLCEVDIRDLHIALEKLLKDDYILSERMMLTGYIEGSEDDEHPISLNDVVVRGAQGGLEIINITVSVNGSYLYSYDCDGIVFSTPTGSTGYNLSGGGPLVSPDTNCIVMTPINAHSLNSRSIILDDTDEIQLTLGSRRSDKTEEAEVSFDGNHRRAIKKDQTLIVKKSSTKVSLIQLGKSSFLERIRSKMQEG